VSNNEASDINSPNTNLTKSFCVDTELHHGFHLGNTFVEPDLGIITRDEQRYHLAPKAMEVLIFLSSTQGEIVSREQILQFAWGDKKASKANVTHVISEIRQALDDHKECPTFIQTISRKGYRMLLPTISKGAASMWTFPGNQSNHIHALSDKKGKLSLSMLKSSRLFNACAAYLVVSWVLLQVFSTVFPIFDIEPLGGKIAALCLVVGFPIVIGFEWVKEIKQRKSFARENSVHSKSFYQQLAIDGFFITIMLLIIFYLSTHLITKIDKESAQQEIMSTTDNIPLADIIDNAVAILPFVALFDDVMPQYIVSGLQEELITFLSLKTEFKVSSLRAITALESDASIEQIKNRLGVRYIVEGKVKLIAQQLVVNITMIDLTTGFQVWADESSATIQELLTLYNELSRKTVNALSLLVSKYDKVDGTEYLPTKNFSAYDAYLQGKEKYRENKDIDALNAAEQLFLQAITLDPQFILASSALCQTYLAKYLLTIDPSEYQKGLNVCQLIADNEQVSFESNLALGTLYRINGQYEKAERFLNAAKKLKPNSTEMLISLANLYTKLEKVEQAEEYYLQAISVELGNWQNYYEYGLFLFSLGRYENAISQFNKVILLNRNIAMAHNALGAMYYMTVDFEKANVAWSKSLFIEPTSATYANLGTVLFMMNRYENAVEMYSQSAELSPLDTTIWGNLGDALKYSKNSQQEAEKAYRKALALANKNALINNKNLSLQAQISRYHSELKSCPEALKIQQAVLNENAQDPYVFYDLAIVSINCHERNMMKKLINKALTLGYPYPLLLADPQFHDYKEWLKQLDR
jgi:DNA-binding winged helix-turn-helix (wHTH) protein/Flp pilus assembly protein TadD/TolB-like protein